MITPMAMRKIEKEKNYKNKELKKVVGKLLNVLSKFPKKKVPLLPDGKGMDVYKFNEVPEILKAKTAMINASNEILGRNVICREWFQDNGFLVAGLVLTFDLQTYEKN